MLTNRVLVSARLRLAVIVLIAGSRRDCSTSEIGAAFSLRAFQSRRPARSTCSRGIHGERFRMHGRKSCRPHCNGAVRRREPKVSS